MNKFNKYFVRVIISLAAIVTLSLYFAPVSFDAFACSGGYSRWIADKYSEELIDIFITEQGVKQNANFNIVSKPEEIANTVKWNGRNIYATLKISIEGKIYTVDYMGKRYWVEKYDWKVIDIVGETA